MPRSARTSSGPEEPTRIGVELIENAARKGGCSSARRLASAGPDPSFFSLDPPIKFLIKFSRISSGLRIWGYFWALIALVAASVAAAGVFAPRSTSGTSTSDAA